MRILAPFSCALAFAVIDMPAPSATAAQGESDAATKPPKKRPGKQAKRRSRTDSPHPSANKVPGKIGGGEVRTTDGSRRQGDVEGASSATLPGGEAAGPGVSGKTGPSDKDGPGSGSSSSRQTPPPPGQPEKR